MIRWFRKIWAAAPVATVILLAGAAIGAFFVVRLVAFSIYWHDPANRDQALAGWMTPGYIAHSWHVPREVVLDALKAPPPPGGHPLNLYELSDLLGVPVADLIAALDSAIADFRAHVPPPPPAKP